MSARSRTTVDCRVPGLLACAMLATSAAAHHTFSGIYDQSQDQQLAGTVKEFRFVHPHPILVIEVRSAEGKRIEWAAEMDNRFELEEIGVTSKTFRPGDEVVVNGSPGRSQPNILYLWKLTRPADGLRYEQVGMSPHLYPGQR
jgi:hypothetical protein